MDIAALGLLGKTKAEVAARIITDWIWNNEDRLGRQGALIRAKASGRTRKLLP